jgi:hypothetical protein
MPELEQQRPNGTNPPSKPTARDSTLIITNGLKLVGLVIGTVQAFSHPPNTSVLIFAGFLIMGVQAVEDLILKTIEKFLGR